MPSIWCRSKKRGEADSEGAWSEARPSGGARCAPQTRPRRRESARAPWPVRSVTGKKRGEADSEGAWTEARPSRGARCAPQTRPRRRESARASWPVRSVRGKKRREADSEGRLERSEAERRGAVRPADQAETEGKRPSALAGSQRDRKEVRHSSSAVIKDF